MSVELVHAALSVSFVAVWAMISRFMVPPQQSPEFNHTPASLQWSPDQMATAKPPSG